MKKVITIIIVVLVALGIGYYLFKISPSTVTNSTSVGYNASLNTTEFKTISSPPAFDPSTDHYIGNKTAKNVFIEYADYECPACAAASDMLKQVPTQFTDTVFVFRYFPLIQIHPNSVEAALAAEAAGAQGKYWEMHDILFKNQSDWEGLSDPLDTFANYAQQVGVTDINQFKNDITNKKYLPAVQKGFDDSMGLNLPGTPSYFFNNHVLQNADLAGLQTEAQQFLNK